VQFCLLYIKEVERKLVGKSEGKRPLGRPRRRREDGIRMDLREIDWGSKLRIICVAIQLYVAEVVLSDYGLGDRAIEVRSPAEARGFFL
jgi:hypothetical protein